MPQIAISYRRDDTKAASRMLFERLQAVFGRQSVFLDFDSIKPGVDFREHINATLQRCDVVVVMIGARWLGLQVNGENRINDAADWVRIEGETALTRRAFVIPVLVDGAQIPAPHQLPESIRELAFLNAVPLDTGIDFEPHSGRLVKAIVNRFPIENDAQSTELIDKKPYNTARLLKRRKRSLLLATGIAVSCIVAIVPIYLFSSAAPFGIAATLHDASWAAAQGDAAYNEKNYNTALQFYRTAADRGNIHAKAQIGILYYNGLGIVADQCKAFQWTNEAANEGDVQGMYNLAEFYFFGICSVRNNNQAAVWYRKAADQGSSAAASALGLAYQHGFGVSQDDALSLQWYQKAANQGDLDAEVRLGELYAAGEGSLPKNRKLARYWMIKAAQGGHKDAQDWLRYNPS